MKNELVRTEFLNSWFFYQFFFIHETLQNQFFCGFFKLSWPTIMSNECFIHGETWILSGLGNFPSKSLFVTKQSAQRCQSWPLNGILKPTLMGWQREMMAYLWISSSISSKMASLPACVVVLLLVPLLLLALNRFVCVPSMECRWQTVTATVNGLFMLNNDAWLMARIVKPGQVN